MSPAHRSKLVIELFKHGNSAGEIACALAQKERVNQTYMLRYVENVITIAKRRGEIPVYAPEPATTG